MSRLNENQVERLLKEASQWEPDAQMPESLIRSALTQSPRRKQMSLFSALSLSGAAFAGLMAFVVFRPEVPTAVVSPPTMVQPVPEQHEPADSAMQAVPNKPRSGDMQLAQNPAEKPSTVNKPSAHEDKPLRKRSHGRRRPRRSSEAELRTPRREVQPDRVEYAPSEYTNEPKPLPDNAIALDESPKIVPVVVADTDPETGEVHLHPAAAVVNTPVVDEPISLE